MKFSSFLKRLRTHIGAHKVKAAGIVLTFLVLGGVAFAFWPQQPVEVVEVRAGEFVRQVSASGKVTPAQEVDMMFENTGRVTRVAVAVGEYVMRGTVLAVLDTAALRADLRAAEADVALRRIEIENQQDVVEKVTEQQDTLVQSAYRALLATDLVAVRRGGATSVTPPRITGAYSGEQEGHYRFAVEKVMPGFDRYEIKTYELEKVEPVRIDEDATTPLGTRGLYVSFPDPIDTYRDTSWEVRIPNTASASYSTKYNAYQEALRERDRRIAEAEAQLRASSSGLTAAGAALERSLAEVARIRSEIEDRSLRAPFDGTVTAVDVEVGGAVSISVPAVSLISDGALEIESFIPEINISGIAPGNTAAVTLDAYGDEEVFDATVLAVDPAETIRDGVSTYRVRLGFVEEDARVLSGMTANIVITTDRRENVRMIPQGAVTRKGAVASVTVLADGKKEKREVVVGQVSSLGEIEILGGLEVGESVVIE